MANLEHRWLGKFCFAMRFMKTDNILVKRLMRAGCLDNTNENSDYHSGG